MQCSAEFSPPRERSHLRGFPPEMQTRASQYLAHGYIAISMPLIPGNIPSGDASYRCVPGCTSLAAYRALCLTLLWSRDSADSWRTCVCGCNAPVRLRLFPHDAPSCSFFFQYDSSQVPRFGQSIYPWRKNACLGSAMSTRLRLLIPTTGAYLAPPAVHKAREWLCHRRCVRHRFIFASVFDLVAQLPCVSGNFLHLFTDLLRAESRRLFARLGGLAITLLSLYASLSPEFPSSVLLGLIVR
jgi:hypothetical protein